MNILDQAITELFHNSNPNKKDWTYKDFPRMTPKLFDEFIELIGEDNIHFITWAEYSDNSVRGQAFISPIGMDIITNYNARVA